MFEIPKSFVDPIATSMAGPDVTVSSAVRLMVGGRLFIVVVEHECEGVRMSISYLFGHAENFLHEANDGYIKAVFLLMIADNKWTAHTIEKIFSSSEGFIVKAATGELLSDGLTVEKLVACPPDSKIVWSTSA